jgi:hypothetical protein
LKLRGPRREPAEREAVEKVLRRQPVKLRDHLLLHEGEDGEAAAVGAVTLIRIQAPAPAVPRRSRRN